MKATQTGLSFLRDLTVAIIGIVIATVRFYLSLWYFLVKGGSYENFPYFQGNLQTRVHLYSLALIFYLWDKPHYRSGTFQQDMVKNLRNVAIPGTGIPLSYFVYSKLSTYFFILVIYPLVSLVASINMSKSLTEFLFHYKEQLLSPQDWFSYWRLNCRLASYHSYIMKDKAPNYAMENKWDFLEKAAAQSVPISPFWEGPATIVVKDKNEEGGMGIHFYSNAACGGNWIIQEVFSNDAQIAEMLPSNAPLSTFRVITASSLGLPSVLDKKQKTNNSEKPKQDISILSCVFRAGRAGAPTDHSCYLFNVDMKTSTLDLATTNDHWYRLGLKGIKEGVWLSKHDMTHHPDGNIPVTGKSLANFKGEIWNMCEAAHRKLLPEVPMAGWDVAITNKGMFLLEVNLSCNFFRGTFNKTVYFSIVDQYMRELDQLKRQKQKQAVSQKA